MCYVEKLLHTPGERVFGLFCTLFAVFFELWPENTGQQKSARAFLLSTPMENEKFSFSIGVDNEKL